MGLSNLNAATKKVLVIVVIVIAAGGIGWYTYHRYRVAQEQKYPKFYSGNGRLEATEVYVSAKIAGRIDQIFIKEGDLVRKGEFGLRQGQRRFLQGPDRQAAGRTSEDRGGHQ